MSITSNLKIRNAAVVMILLKILEFNEMTAIPGIIMYAVNYCLTNYTYMKFQTGNTHVKNVLDTQVA